MKKFLPYILAYLIVATATAVYPHIYMHLVKGTHGAFPRNSVTVVTIPPGMTHEQLVARLNQVGLSEPTQTGQSLQKGQISRAVTVRPASLFQLYIFDAVMLVAFVGLVNLFQRAFRLHAPVHAA